VKHDVQVVDELQVLQIGLHILHVDVPSSYNPVGQAQFWSKIRFDYEHVLHTPPTEHVEHLAGHDVHVLFV
jgi:hypothetical protein